MDYYKDYQELFEGAVLWFTGYDQTNLGFPILPAGVTVTPNGTFYKTDLGNNKSVLNFDGSTNYMSLSDNDAWHMWLGDATFAAWASIANLTSHVVFLTQRVDGSNQLGIYRNYTNNILVLFIISSGVDVGVFSCPFSPTQNVWYHISILRSGTSCLMYINGVSQTVTQIAAFATVPNLSAAFNIGYGSAQGYATGNLKDLLVYKGRALTQVEIVTLMRLTEPGKRDITPILPGIRGVE